MTVAQNLLQTRLPFYQAALNGTLASPNNTSCMSNVSGAAEQLTVIFSNRLEIPISVAYAAAPGLSMPSGQTSRGGELIAMYSHAIPAMGTSSGVAPASINGRGFGFRLGQCIVVTSAETGGLICALQLKNAGQIIIDCTMTLPPGVVGPFPTPHETLSIPADSRRVVVGCGNVSNSLGAYNGYLIREQYWERQGNSYTLAPFERRSVSFTMTAGKETTTSSLQSMASSVGVNASGGWGAVSANISANLSANSTHFQQVTVTEQTSSTVSTEIYNNTAAPATYFRWQLTDVITVFIPSAHGLMNCIPAASLVMTEAPVLVDGPYDPNALPASPALYQPPMPQDMGVNLMMLSCGSTLTPNVVPFISDSVHMPYSFAITGSTQTKSIGNSITIGAGILPPIPPQAVYQSCRLGTDNSGFTYTLSNLRANAAYTVILHFAETVVFGPGQRIFTITINDVVVNAAFDIYAEAGGKNIALAKRFPTTARSSGQIVIGLTPHAGKNYPMISGIVVQAG